ncbi:MAG TPA: DUF6311 domain-containing protein, partial [Devosia sp.]|nr:DUF6311 domain-containing protein [Devosia sp.]
DRRHRSLAWGALLTLSALVHTYFLAMCVPIWIASLVGRRGKREFSAPWWLEVPAVLAAIGAALWLGGFFPLRSSLMTYGYGIFSLNLLSLVNPNGSFVGPWSWSAILPMLPQGGGEYEGFNYLGAGGLVAVIVGLVLAWLDRAAYARRHLWPLAIAAIALALFAITPKVTVADLQLTIPVPRLVYALAGSIRASGRFFWPVFYMIVLGALWLCNRRFGSRVTGPLLLVLAALQIYDTYPGWGSFTSKFALDATSWQTPLSDPRLVAVASHYAAVRALPATNQVPGWDQIAYFALRNHKPTDAVYLARPNDAAYAQYNARLDQRIALHGLESDSIYFLDRIYAHKIAATMAPADAMFQVGRFYVFAPGWRRFGVATDLPPVTDFWR